MEQNENEEILGSEQDQKLRERDPSPILPRPTGMDA